MDQGGGEGSREKNAATLSVAIEIQNTGEEHNTAQHSTADHGMLQARVEHTTVTLVGWIAAHEHIPFVGEGVGISETMKDCGGR